MNSSTSPRILIVEDEPAIADTLAFALQRDGFATTIHSLGRKGIEALATDRFALIILDVGLPDMTGFDVCREIRRASEIPVIFLTARSDEVDRIVGLELGADDYVAKPFSPREVVARVRAILRRTHRNEQKPESPFRIDTDGARIAYHGTWLSLTRYEYGLLAALLERPGRILSRAQLMDLVWQDGGESLERTVDAHIKTLRSKLRTISEDDSIETHRGLGYSIRADGA